MRDSERAGGGGRLNETNKRTASESFLSVPHTRCGRWRLRLRQAPFVAWRGLPRAHRRLSARVCAPTPWPQPAGRSKGLARRAAAADEHATAASRSFPVCHSLLFYSLCCLTYLPVHADDKMHAY